MVTPLSANRTYFVAGSQYWILPPEFQIWFVLKQEILDVLTARFITPDVYCIWNYEARRAKSSLSECLVTLMLKYYQFATTVSHYIQTFASPNRMYVDPIT